MYCISHPDHYCNLEFLNTIPALAYQSLERAAARRNRKLSYEALLQLGLCKIVGFGVPQDLAVGLEQVKEAAALGHTQAKAITFRLYAAVGISIPQSDMAEMLSWLRAAATAAIAHGLIAGPHVNATIDHQLRNAVQFGRLELVRGLLIQGGKIYWKDEDDASCLYWVSLCFEETAPQITILLLDSEAQVNVKSERTHRTANAGGDNKYLNVVPPQTTPLEWAIMQDNLPVMRVLLEASMRDDSTFFYDDIESTPVGCASRYQSQQCLAWLCNHNGPEVLRAYDEYGFSALYYAIHPDVLDRMLRYPVGTRKHQGYSPRPFPVVEREIEVIKTLLEYGSELTVHEDDAFTCLLLAAALAHPEVLRTLLAVPQSTELLEGLSKEQCPPLKDALFRGDVGIFTMLLQRLTATTGLWCVPQYHAIHLCCTAFHATSPVLAGLLYAKDPLCLLRQSKPSDASPLHIAAARGNIAMIDFCISHRAFLLCGAEGLTPPG